MQARAEAVGEREIVHITFAVHPHRPKLCVVTVGFGVLGQAETEFTVKVIALLYVRREAIEMIDALNPRAAMRFIFLQHTFGSIHLRAEVERHAQRVGGPQGTALVRNLREGGRQVAAAEPECGAIEILFACNPKTERADLSFAGSAQHDRMVAPLLDAAEIEGVLAFVADQKPQAIDIEGAGAAEIADAELDMAGAYDVERRIEDRVAEGHALSPLTVAAATSNTSPRVAVQKSALFLPKARYADF